MKLNFGKIDIDENVKEKIEGAIKNGRLSHAILLTGANARIRKNLAEKIGATLLCKDTKVRPCGKCPACIKTKANYHPDIYTLEGTDKPRSIKIDDVRKLRDRAIVVPNEADYKIFLILEASGMGLESQNAILKLIEEPPKHTRFILATDSKENLLPTIQSRVINYHLGEAISRQTGKTKENIETITEDILKALVKGSEYDLMLSTAPLEKNRLLFRRCMERAIEILHLSLRPDVDTGKKNDIQALIAKKLDKKDIYLIIKSLKELEMNADKNANENLLLASLSSNLFKISNKI